jgi:hypothetical protein
MSAPRAKKRLRPGELDGLVLAYMRKHRATDRSPPARSAKGSTTPQVQSPTAWRGWQRRRSCARPSANRAPTRSPRRSRDERTTGACGLSRAEAQATGRYGVSARRAPLHLPRPSTDRRRALEATAMKRRLLTSAAPEPLSPSLPRAGYWSAAGKPRAPAPPPFTATASNSYELRSRSVRPQPRLLP